MFTYVSISACLVLLNCQASPTQENKNLKRSADSPEVVDNLAERNEAVGDTTGFLRNCSAWSTGEFDGFIQGVSSTKDSLGPFFYYDCYDCKPTFEIIFAYKTVPEKSKISEDSIWKIFENGCTDTFKDFECFAFVYPFRDPDKQKDEATLNFNLPVTVKSFERTNKDHWQSLTTKKLTTWQQLSKFQFNTIYGIK